jgi:hypothetical protein
MKSAVTKVVFVECACNRGCFLRLFVAFITILQADELLSYFRDPSPTLAIIWLWTTWGWYSTSS